MDKNYNVDDILSEIKRKKSQEKGQPISSGGFPQPEHREEREPEKNRKDDFVVRIPEEDLTVGSSEEDRDFRVFAPGRDAPPKNKEFHFRAMEGKRSRSSGVAEESGNPLDFESHVRPITDKAKMRNRPQRDSVSRSAGEKGEFRFDRGGREDEDSSHHTRVMPKFATGRELRLEDIQKMDFGPENQHTAEFYYDDVYEGGPDSIPDSSKMDFSEYNSVENRDDVATDIAHTKLWLFIRSGVTLLLTAISFYFAISGRVDALPMPEAIWPVGDTIRMFIAVSTLLVVGVALINSSAMGGGLISFFKLRANADSLVAFAVLASIAQGITGIVRPETVDPKAMSFYFPIACTAMLFNSLGKMTMINRIQQNFRVLGSDLDKRAVLPAESDSFCHEFVEEAVSRHRPTVAYSMEAEFFTDFLALSYSDKYDVGINRSVAPVCVIGAVIVAGATFLLTSHMASAVSALTAILCICATFSSTFIENIPLGKIAKRLSPSGAMVSGSKAVEDFCDTKAVALTENDLFGQGRVSLRGIKAFSQGRIDEAILDAASVLCALDGALAPMFLQMINGNKKLLKKVENIVFETDMGVSAWIDSRRVLIGNRRLMQTHGIALPADSYERGEAGDVRGEPIYLSNSGEVSARFLVEYLPDEELAVELDQLAAREIRLVVATSDANINAQKIWEAYGYPEDLVSVMSSDRLAEFRQMSAKRPEAIAEIVYTGRATALVQSILACISARASILSATIVELVQMILGYGLVAFMAFMGAIGVLSVPRMLVYQLFWFLAIFIVQQVRQS